MSSADLKLHRSYLYAPGSAPRVMHKALMSGADAVVLDLEDAVAPAAKDLARADVAKLLDELDPAATAADVHVRINRDGEGYSERDLESVVVPGLDGLRLPKAETAEAIAHVAARIDQLERDRGLAAGRIRLYPILESALGAVQLAELTTASPRTARFSFGAADLLADLGAFGDDDLATLTIRSELIVRSRVAGIGPPIDSVFTNLDDLEGLRSSAGRARALGFVGKSIIHPRQLAVVRDVFTPSDEAIAHAERIIATFDAAERDGRGADAVGGEFVDAATVARARAVLSMRSEP